MATIKWQKVVYAEDLPDCEQCDDKWCPKHKMHYGDCSCIGPTQEGVMYKEKDGVMYGREMTAAEVERYSGKDGQ